ncbi:MAG: glycosyltransferase family 9 protein [Fusobacteriaceae bacterium]
MKILIIHTAFIGDIVLSTPLIKKIKDVYKESTITYLTTPVGYSILKNNLEINEIIIYDKRGKDKGVINFFKLAKKINLEKFDIVITLHRYLRSSILSWLTGSPIRKGYKNATFSWCFTEKIKYRQNIHEVERILSFLPKNNEKADCEYKIELFPKEEEALKIKNLIGEYKGKKIVTIAPGSKWFTKKWPLEYFNEVIKNLKEEKNIFQIIIGGKEEKLLNVVIGENCIDLRGKTSLLDLAEILKISDVVLTNDSSPIHLASAFKNTYIIALFGPTVEKFGFFPWSKNSEVLENKKLECRPCAIHGGNHCPKGHFKCMLSITPEEVIKKIRKKIKIN